MGAIPKSGLKKYMNSGLISTTSGTTNTFIGILNRQEVLSVSQEESVSDNVFENGKVITGLPVIFTACHGS